MTKSNTKRTELFAREHLNAVAEIERLSFSSPWSEKSLLLLLDGVNFGVIAVCEGRPVAYGGVIVAEPEGEITNVATHPNFRRRGYGESVLTAIVSEAEKRGVKRLFLEVRESNLGAIALYEKQGFTKVGVRKNFYTAPREDAILMTWELGA